MIELKIGIAPNPTSTEGPRLDSFASLLTSKHVIPEFTSPSEGELIVNWTPIGDKVRMEVVYGNQRALSEILLTIKPALSLSYDGEQIFMEILDKCEHIDERILMGQVLGLATLLVTGEVQPEEAQVMVKDIIKYTAPDSKGVCRPPAAYPLDLSHYIKESISSVEKAANALVEMATSLKENNLVPQVGINIVQSPPPPYHIEPANHVGIPTRIVETKKGLTYASPPRAGGSRHLSRALVAYMEYYPDTRSVMNLAYSPGFIEKAQRAGLRVSSYDRREEPPEVKEKEGGTMPWGVRRAIEKCVEKPHIIYHRGDWGKEPMINIFAPTAEQLIDILTSVL